MILKPGPEGSGFLLLLRNAVFVASSMAETELNLKTTPS
jgi:hypothetical protein